MPALLGELGNATEPKSGRKFFLDYPCDLKKNEKVVLILSLHGERSVLAASLLPAFDYKEKYRLVIATPTAANSAAIFTNQPPVRMWTADGDDEYLHNVVDYLLEIGRKNVSAFWSRATRRAGSRRTESCARTISETRSTAG